MDEMGPWQNKKKGAILEKNFSNAFSWMKISIFGLKFILKVQMTVGQYCLRTDDKPLPEAMMTRLIDDI